ncbi:uncharacterized protein TRIADDRAFT_57993 [Trichoplax adhaerens]|uniref:Uncharacterized protein n=1 Tax=Trichoplax adhaerens TaxID=10228 RepID=B3S2E3_TRIAD|nr:predicted protein [Trichoplax adhaerens]EDV23084.1 predicted protein [Trichoplax adhaerens]|eukprot:XP_002113994.1 predicted protein [Trichoplax adhaerens]
MTIIKKGDTLTKLPKRLDFGSLFTGIKTKGVSTHECLHESATSSGYHTSLQAEEDHYTKDKVDVALDNQTAKSTLFIDVFTAEQLLKRVVDNFLCQMQRKAVKLNYNFNSYDYKRQSRGYLKKTFLRFTDDDINHNALTQYQHLSYTQNTMHKRQQLHLNQARAIDWPHKTDDNKSCARTMPFTNCNVSCARCRPFKSKEKFLHSHNDSAIKCSVNDLSRRSIKDDDTESLELVEFLNGDVHNITSRQVDNLEVSCARTRPCLISANNSLQRLEKRKLSKVDVIENDSETVISCARCRDFNFCKITNR